MTLEPHDLKNPGARGAPVLQWKRGLPGIVAVVVGCAGFFAVLVLHDRGSVEPRAASLSASPSPALESAIFGNQLPFERSVVRMIEEQGYITVTVHVALADRSFSSVAPRFGDGDDPTTNLCWGALYGVETHLANAGGWRRAHTDDGDGAEIIRRVVFHRPAEPTEAWLSRGVTASFDVYVLANAWPSSAIVAAMEQPLRDAMTDTETVLTVDGNDIAFGAASAVVGYFGYNRMLDEYWDPFAGLTPGDHPFQAGVFYLCSRSAVVLHQPVVDRGLYSVLFVREPIVPEAYLLDGMLKAIVRGELADGVLTGTAEEYARFQTGVSPGRARAMLYR